MEGFCRSCLIKFDEPTDLITYSEKNRRMFVYATGLQAKRNDTFTFQLCKECYLNMKVACNFKKSSRNSDKKFKNYLATKEAEDNIDFCNYLKHNDDSLKFRLPVYNGNSTPANRNNDDDNESTCTSIHNFMTDILQAEEIPDSEARIIKEVIEEEADVLEDSLDSHWLQDDVSIDTDFRLDFSFSPFSTPHSTNGQCYTPKRLKDNNAIMLDEVIRNNANVIDTLNVTCTPEVIESNKLIEDQKDEFGEKCVIDINLANALKNETKKVMLDELLATPPVVPNISAPSTPLIKNILFGDKIDLETEIIESRPKNVYMPSDLMKQAEIDVLYELLKKSDDKTDNNEPFVGDYDDIYIPDINGKQHAKHSKLLDDAENNSSKVFVKNDKNDMINEVAELVNQPPSYFENKYCLKEMLCKICDRKFKQAMALKIHFKRKHKFQLEAKKRVYRKMICDYCGKIFMTSKSMVKHIQSHMNPNQYDCQHCPLLFKTESALKVHQTTHGIVNRLQNKSKKGSYVCNICGSAQSSSSNHKTHMRRHGNHYSVSCALCGRGFYRNSDLEVHMRRHTGERPYECMYCPSKFARMDALNRHIKSHTGERPYSCTVCDGKFFSAFHLKQHQLRSKSCLGEQASIVWEASELNNVDKITVYYANVTNNEDGPKNVPPLIV